MALTPTGVRLLVHICISGFLRTSQSDKGDIAVSRFFMFNLKSGFRRLEAKGEQHYGNTTFMESYVQEKCTKSARRANL